MARKHSALILARVNENYLKDPINKDANEHNFGKNSTTNKY